MLKDLKFAPDGPTLIYQMYDNSKNNNMYFEDFIRLVRISFTYSQLTPAGVQRFNWEALQTPDDYFMSRFNLFPYEKNEQNLN